MFASLNLLAYLQAIKCSRQDHTHKQISKSQAFSQADWHIEGFLTELLPCSFKHEQSCAILSDLC